MDAMTPAGTVSSFVLGSPQDDRNAPAASRGNFLLAAWSLELGAWS
jgi:hypothetical protein